MLWWDYTIKQVNNMTWKDEIRKEITDKDVKEFLEEDYDEDWDKPRGFDNSRIRDYSIIRTKVYNAIVDISKEFELDKDKTLSVVKRVLAHMEGRDSL